MRKMKLLALLAAFSVLSTVSGCSMLDKLKLWEKEPAEETAKSAEETTQSSEKKGLTAAKNEKETEEPKDTGLTETETFTLTIPEGWCIGWQSEDSIRLLKASSKDDYDSFSQPSFELSLTDYKMSSSDASDSLEKLVENDHQFFENKEPLIENASTDPYLGYKLSGNSASFKGCTLEYYDMDSWVEGTNLRSRLKIRLTYYDDEQKKEVEDILASVDTTVEIPEAQATEDSGTVIEKDSFTMTVPEGWSVKSADGLEVKLESEKFPGGYISIAGAPKDAEAYVNWKNESYGGENEIWEREYSGQTWTGVQLTQSMELMAVNSSDGSCVYISGMRVPMDQISDVVESITLNSRSVF